ncbi:hypothetical protein ACI65C_013844 [Semiaphis heraclei]
MKRNNVVTNIKNVFEMSSTIVSSPDLVPKFLRLAHDTENLWTQFNVENYSLLDALIDLDKIARLLILENSGISQRVPVKSGHQQGSKSNKTSQVALVGVDVPQPKDKLKSSSTTATSMTSAVSDRNVMLGKALVHIRSHLGPMCTVRALIGVPNFSSDF